MLEKKKATRDGNHPSGRIGLRFYQNIHKEMKMAPARKGEGSNANASRRNSGTPDLDNGSSKYTSGLHLFRKEFHQKNKGKAQLGKARDMYRNGEINEAWRSLPEEVKAMYNQEAKNERKQFREVHGPRKKYQTAFQTKCSPKYFQLGLANLSDSQREEVKSMGFESLLKMTGGTLSRDLCFELCNLFDPWSRCLNIRGKSIAISAEDVGSILGIPASGREVPVRGLMIEDLKHSFGDLEFKEYPNLFGNGEAKGLYFKRAFLLFSLGVLLCPTTKTKASTKHFYAVVDAENAIQYNWGKFVLNWLVEGVRSQKPLLCNNTRLKTKPPKWFAGCVYFLMIFYFQSFPLDPHRSVSNTYAIEYWTSENVYHRIKYEKEAKNNHSEEVEPSDSPDSLGTEDGDFVYPVTMTQHEDVVPEARVGQETTNNHEVVNEVPVMESPWDYSFVTNTTPIHSTTFFDDLAREEDWLFEYPTQEGQVSQEIPLEESTSPPELGQLLDNLGEVDGSFFGDLPMECERFFSNPIEDGQVSAEAPAETSTLPQIPLDHNSTSNEAGSRMEIAAAKSTVDIDHFLGEMANDDAMFKEDD